MNVAFKVSIVAKVYPAELEKLETLIRNNNEIEVCHYGNDRYRKIICNGTDAVTLRRIKNNEAVTRIRAEHYMSEQAMWNRADAFFYNIKENK